jgi:hypothetical protein
LSLVRTIVLTMADTYCPKTGDPHSQHPSSFKFCPACCAQIQLSTPVRREPEVITLDDTPEQPKAKAMFVPATYRVAPLAKAHSRTAAETARQQSIQRTSQPARGSVSTRLPILLFVDLVRYEVVNEGTWERKKFLEYDIMRTLLCL